MKEDLIMLGDLIRRGLKMYLSDKMAVFLSVLSPLIILFLYLMFLGDIQYNSVMDTLDKLPIEVSNDAVHAFIDGWMLAGVLAVSCITVSFCAQYIMINDRETGAVMDMLTSPIKRSVLSVSYFVVNFIITTVVVGIIAVIALIYLAISGWYLNGADVGKLIGILLLSVLSASLFTTLISMFFRTQSAHGGASGILSAAIGFFIGAYMPIAVFPKAIQYFVLFMPGTYSAGVLRNILMRGALDSMIENVPAAAVETMRSGFFTDFSMDMDAFGTSIYESDMWLIFACSVILFIILYVVNQAVRTKTGTLFSAPKPRKKVKTNKK